MRCEPRRAAALLALPQRAPARLAHARNAAPTPAPGRIYYAATNFPYGDAMARRMGARMLGIGG